MKHIDYKKYFEGKRITKQGFGVLGRGYGVVKFLLESGARMLMTDMKPLEFFKEQINDLENFCIANNINFGNVSFRFGEHKIEDFENCDYVIAASGVPKDNIYLRAARNKNIKVYQESSLFCEIVREFNQGVINNSENKNLESFESNVLKNAETIKIIGITGTRGKTTTTFLIKAILESFAESENQKNGTDVKVYFGGNVQGVATLENLKYVKSGDFVVMELDSWVLQGFGEIKFSPHVAVFTTFMPDHMNYYKGDMQDYFKDKANIFLYQGATDVFVTTEDIKTEAQAYLGDYRNLYHLYSSEVVVTSQDIQSEKSVYQTRLLGEHNRIPVSLAARAAEVCGVDADIVKKLITEFKGVKGRLELIKETSGVRIYNDTTATTGDAAVAGLLAVRDSIISSENQSGKIIFITGGRDKELDMTRYLETIQKLHDDGGRDVRHDPQRKNTKALKCPAREHIEHAKKRAA
jgi:UDP-N-acetylmuramoylalanine--D-glutamate ligase